MSQDNPKRYLRSLPVLANAEDTIDEFPTPSQEPPPGWTRRSFLKATGFVFAGAVVAGCQRVPVEHAVSYTDAPENVTPGQSLHYASTCDACSAGCGLLVESRDGRPIKLEGNPGHPLSRGGLCPMGQASLLGLYDRFRLQQPHENGQRTSWPQIDGRITEQLDRIRQQDGKVRFLTGTITSPTTKAAIQNFVETMAGARHITYDALSCSAILDAHERTHNSRVLPHYRLDRAKIIISFDVEFLSTWISPVEFTSAYATHRVPSGDPLFMSYHVQFESRMSLTGSNADKRVVVPPEEMGLLMTHLASRLAQKTGASFGADELGETSVSSQFLDRLADRLWDARGECVVLCGLQDTGSQIIGNYINHLLGNYGSTIDLNRPSFQQQGNDAQLASLLDEMKQGQVAALFLYKCNPVFDLANENLAEWISDISLVVNFAERLDETARVSTFLCPDHQYLETWSDAEPVDGVVSLTQPILSPMGATRSILESLANWRGRPQAAYDQIRAYWESSIYPRSQRNLGFQRFWDQTLHDGYAEVNRRSENSQAVNVVQATPIREVQRPANGSYSLVLYPKGSMRDGRGAYNPWLQELPDPISKVAWDNYACLSPETAQQLNVSQGDLVRLQARLNGTTRTLELPAYVQPGQHDRVVAVALGYGSVLSERFANIGPQWLHARSCVGDNGKVGKNAAGFINVRDGLRRMIQSGVRLTKRSGRHLLACTQTHHFISVPPNLAPPGERRRPVIQESTLTQFIQERNGREHAHHEHADLWPNDHPITGHHWAMAIDLNKCTGCSGCVVACQVENNIPVVGRDEVYRQREMHWLRIDRYYAGDGYNIDVAHQPMLCQHCDNAPCETVCPVLATVHSQEGLNQQVYNRCVGTRYCANNCPYKVRRFNWFAYPRPSTRENLVLNPDVTVRSRGVMEKCTFCVQRIQEAKIQARVNGEELRDGTLQTACQQSCPAQAIVFGDINDPESNVRQLAHNRRSYQVLAELNVRPSVHYLKLVRNR